VDLIARYVHQVLSEMENARIRGRFADDQG